MKVHHGSCPKALAWDIPDVPCSCPPGWPQTREQFRDGPPPDPAGTPRPWRLGPGKHGATTILGANGRTVALCQSVSWDAPTAEARANAELIVRAVNGVGEGEESDP